MRSSTPIVGIVAVSLLVGLTAAALAFSLQLDQFTTEGSCMPRVQFVDDPDRVEVDPSCVEVNADIVPLTALGAAAGLLTAAALTGARHLRRSRTCTRGG